MNHCLPLPLACLLLWPLTAHGQGYGGNVGWQYSAGFGVASTPAYLGDNDYQLTAVPDVSIKYGDTFFASLYEGIGYNAVNQGGLKMGPVMKFDFGRQEDGGNPLRIGGSDTDDLIGLGDVDMTLELGGFVSYQSGNWTSKLGLRHGLNGHEGLIGQAEVKYGGQLFLLGKPAFFSIGPQLKFADADYHNAYFGVNASQSMASGLGEYNAGGGLLSYGIDASLFVPLTERVSAAFFANFSRLGDEGADSSLVRERGSPNQAFIGTLLQYKF